MMYFEWSEYANKIYMYTLQQELEEELQALERRIDTEFKSTD